MAVWVVRGGLDGEYEEDAPEKCVIRIGFDMNVDLTDASEFDDVKNLVQWAHEGAPQARVANFAGQIWAFKGEMQIGDLIIVPRKGPSIMAVGEVGVSVRILGIIWGAQREPGARGDWPQAGEGVLTPPFHRIVQPRRGFSPGPPVYPPG